jgi:hypothetical protein
MNIPRASVEVLKEMVKGKPSLTEFTDSVAKHGYSIVRPVKVNGEPMIVTKEILNDRINVEVVTTKFTARGKPDITSAIVIDVTSTG